MSARENSARHRLAGWISHLVVLAWPEKTNGWALALEAEICAIEKPGPALRWALGGVMLLTRAWWNHLMRSWMRPAGVPEGGPLAELAKNATRVPRTPRFVTAILLLASLALLFVPDVRDGIKATFNAWSYYGWWAGANDHATVARLRQVGEQNHNAQALGVVALLAEDHTERMQVADKAVALDPSLTWIYAYVRTTDGVGSCCNGPTPAAWLDRLQKWDPDNAVPRLLVADQGWLRFDEEWQKSGYRGAYEVESLKYLQQDKSWLAAMESAFQAPKYDHYYSRVFDLYRTVAQRYGIRDMATTEAILQSNFRARAGTGGADIYAKFLAERAGAAERAGNYKEAEELYRRPVEFSERMAGQTHTNGERDNWERIEGDSLRRLQLLLAKTGRSDEAALVGFKADALQTNRIAWGPERDWSWDENGWEGFMIRSFTGAILVLAVLSLASLAYLFLRRRTAAEARGFGLTLASLAVDFCPLLLLFACAGLYVAYRPIALIYDQYMTWPYPVYDFRALSHALYTPHESPEGIGRIFYDYLTPVHMWMMLIVGLSMLAFYILFRGTLRRRVKVS